MLRLFATCSPLESRQDLRPFGSDALQLSAVDSQRLDNQRRNLRRENPLREHLRFPDSRTADEASYVPVVGAQPAVLFDFLFRRRVDDSNVRLDNDVGYERIVDGGSEPLIAPVSDMD